MSYKLDDDCELPPRLVALFLRTAPDQMKDLVDACQARNHETTRAHAHKLKGALYAAGASQLADELEALRAAAAGGDWTKVEARLAKAREDFSSVVDQWRARLAATS